MLPKFEMGWVAREVRSGSKPDIGGVIARGPLLSGNRTSNARPLNLTTPMSAYERKADSAAWPA